VPTEWAFIASRNAHVFHAPGCKAVSRISAGNAQYFADSDQARAAGHRPCSKCC